MEIDQLVELVRKRRSIRRFKPDPVPAEYIGKILEAARWAMSGANGQPWEFIVVTNQDTKNKISEADNEQVKLSIALEMSRVREMRQPAFRDIPDVIPNQGLNDAPVIIILCADPRTAQASQLNRLCDRRWVVDENMATTAQIIHLAAAAIGLGSRWITVNWLSEQLIKSILGIPPIIRIFSMIPIGYPAYY
ncbi:nitroreductase family protein, partial [Chloroflexota bacterium]